MMTANEEIRSDAALIAAMAIAGTPAPWGMTRLEWLMRMTRHVERYIRGEDDGR
jgi:hypothetical protein